MMARPIAAERFVMSMQRVTLVSSAEETAKDVLKQLSTTDMLADESTTPTHHFESTGDPELFSQLAKRFLGPHVTHVEKLEPM